MLAQEFFFLPVRINFLLQGEKILRQGKKICLVTILKKMFAFRNHFFGRSLFVNIFSLDLILIQLRSVCCKHDTGVPYFAAAASLLLFSLLLVFATSAGIITRRDCSFTRLMVNLRKCRPERASQSQKASKRIGREGSLSPSLSRRAANPNYLASTLSF